MEVEAVQIGVLAQMEETQEKIRPRVELIQVRRLTRSQGLVR